jgi:hypothetical protein
MPSRGTRRWAVRPNLPTGDLTLIGSPFRTIRNIVLYHRTRSALIKERIRILLVHNHQATTRSESDPPSWIRTRAPKPVQSDRLALLFCIM